MKKGIFLCPSDIEAITEKGHYCSNCCHLGNKSKSLLVNRKKERRRRRRRTWMPELLDGSFGSCNLQVSSKSLSLSSSLLFLLSLSLSVSLFLSLSFLFYKAQPFFFSFLFPFLLSLKGPKSRFGTEPGSTWAGASSIRLAARRFFIHCLQLLKFATTTF